MAERETLDLSASDAHSACGCKTAKHNEATTCPVITCGPCPQTVKVGKKSERRICIDFSSCEWCLDDGGCKRKYFLMGIPKGEVKNSPFCVDSEGRIAFKSLNMNQDTGKLWLTIDALDPRLNMGEVRYFEWMVQGPDMTRKTLKFNISVGD